MPTLQGSFMNITLGEMTEILINGFTPGWAEKFSVKSGVEYAEFKAKTPLVRIGKAKTKVTSSLECTLKELRPENFILALGIKNTPLTNILGSNVTTYETTGETKTLGARNNGALKQVDLTGYNLNDAVVVKANTSGGSTLTENSDYIVDRLRGVVILINRDLYSTVLALYVEYTFVRIAQKQINFMPEDFVLEQCDIKATHNRISDGTPIVVEIFDAQANETTVNFSPTAFSDLALKFSAIYNGKRKYCYGRITWKAV
jgi:hypothetical protein